LGLSTTDLVFKILKLLDIAVDRKTENKTIVRVSFIVGLGVMDII
jgi:hypothetical protein